MKREKANYMIQSVSHAIDVLEELAHVRGEVGVTELSKRLKLHKNNVFRLLATLELRGYVEQNPQSEDYRLGVKVLELGQAYLIQSNVVQRSTPILRRLADETGETASLAILQNGQVQYPISFEPKKPVRVAGRIATSVAAKQSAVGRLLTAQLSDAALDEILAPNTAQDAAIRNQLSELRGSGKVLDKGATEAEVVALSQVVRGTGNTIVGAIEVLAPQFRVNVSALEEALERSATELSSALGGTKATLSGAIEKSDGRELTSAV
ncbi:IclR family transcriptional regulator [bacterium]|nr:IclR family transcriptional regulator [bacterium]